MAGIKYFLKVCDDGSLVQIPLIAFFGHCPSCCLSLKCRPVSLSRHKSIQLVPISGDRD
jgi:hypothetical protein